MPKKVNKPIPIMIAVPNEGNISTQLASKLIEIVVTSVQSGKYEPTMKFSKFSGIDYNRNLIVQEFLKTDCQYLMMIDDDNPPLKNPLDLIDLLDSDIMVVPTLMNKDGQLAFNVFRKYGKIWGTFVYEGEKEFSCKRAGTGCVIIKRKVLETIKRPFETKVNPANGIRNLGEDLFFCDKAIKAGFEIRGSWDYVASHYKTIDLLEVADMILKAKAGKQIAPSVQTIK